LLTSVLKNDTNRHPLVLLQSSLSQTSLPILRNILVQNATAKGSPRHNVLFCVLYQPSSLTVGSSNSIETYDWTDRIPGFGKSDYWDELLSIVEKALEVPSRSTSIIIDSIDTALLDNGSLAETYKNLSKVCELVKKRPDARLVLHCQSPSSLFSLVTQTAFSSSLSHVVTHPPALIAHIATEFLMPPPPLSPLPKFWSVFLPISERIYDAETLVFGTNGEGSGNSTEFVIELIVREGSGKNRGVERVLEGWSDSLGGPCDLTALESIKPFTKKQIEIDQAATPDPTQNLLFNLNLTSSQQESRARVPLPYAHEGTPITSNTPAAIFYDPDSADDIDDDDPDEDLDI
ncbi:hypothetical protein BDN70DRAFT_763951, partial [Pholiota conissans]